METKEEKREYHHARQQSITYKATQKSKAEKKKKNLAEEEQESKKRGHTYDEKKELYPNKKQKVIQPFEQGDIIFAKFATIFHYGIVLEVADDPIPGFEYMLKFVDGQVRDDLTLKDLRSFDAMKPDWRCWVPRDVCRSSLKFSEFEAIANDYESDLQMHFDIYERGELVIDEM